MDNPEERIGQLLRVLREVYRAEVEAVLQPLGITPSQFGALFQVDHSPGLSAAQLARRNYVKPQSTHEIVGQLKRAGLIQREPHPELGRVLRIYATPKGRTILKRCLDLVEKVEEQMVSDLTDAETDQLRTLLFRALHNLQAYRRDRAVESRTTSG